MKIRDIKINKKADASITLLVVMTIVLCGFALISFYLYGNRNVQDTTDFKALGNLYMQEKSLENYFYGVAYFSVQSIQDQNKPITKEEVISSFINNHKNSEFSKGYFSIYNDYIENRSNYEVFIFLNGNDIGVTIILKDFPFVYNSDKEDKYLIRNAELKKSILIDLNFKAV